MEVGCLKGSLCQGTGDEDCQALPAEGVHKISYIYIIYREILFFCFMFLLNGCVRVKLSTRPRPMRVAGIRTEICGAALRWSRP